jgi:hypothetical protein
MRANCREPTPCSIPASRTSRSCPPTATGTRATDTRSMAAPLSAIRMASCRGPSTMALVSAAPAVPARYGRRRSRQGRAPARSSKWYKRPRQATCNSRLHSCRQGALRCNREPAICKSRRCIFRPEAVLPLPAHGRHGRILPRAHGIPVAAADETVATSLH